MAGGQVPGPLNGGNQLGSVQDGTLQPTASPTPGVLSNAGTPGAGVGATAVAGATAGAAAVGAAAQVVGSVVTAAAQPTDPAIEALDLAETAKKAAYELKKQHPTVEFTSGRRDRAGQASAMAGNVVENRKWIEETYSKSAARTACQKWVDDNPDKKQKAEISAGLLTVLKDLTDKQLGRLSKHLSGDAFDVQPVEADAEAIKSTIRGLTGLSKFLEKEGGLVRWHAQF